MKKIYCILVSAILIGLIILLAWNFVSNKEKKYEVEKINNISVAYNIQLISSLPIVVAQEKGFFLKQGLDVKLIDLGGTESMTALSVGQVDVASIGITTLLSFIDKGVPVKAFSPSSISKMGVYVRGDSNIKKLEDIIGKVVSVRGNSGRGLALKYALRKEGLDYNKIEFAGIDETYEAIALLEKKSVDAIIPIDSDYSQYGDRVMALPGWFEKGYAENPSGMVVFSSQEDYLNKNSVIIRKFLLALIETQKYIKENPQGTSQAFSEFVKKETLGAIDYTPDVVQEKIERGDIKFYSWVNPTMFSDVANISYETETIKNKLTEKNIFDGQFTDLLLNAQGEIYDGIN
ncbi:MAG: ABC transporter substrate-binding protein [Candidatus Magasanikbacteria bacterium]